jgi:hypothetical protein
MRHFLGTLPLVAGIVLVVWQCFSYLRLGVWHPVSTMDVLAVLNVSWAKNPTSWFGLARVLGAIPGSLALVVYGGVFSVIFALEPRQPKPAAVPPRPFRVRVGTPKEYLGLGLIALPAITFLSIPGAFATGADEQSAWGLGPLVGIVTSCAIAIVGSLPGVKGRWRVYRAIRIIVLGFWWAVGGYFLGGALADGSPDEIRIGYICAGVVGLAGAYFHALRMMGRTPEHPDGSVSGSDPAL